MSKKTLAEAGKCAALAIAVIGIFALPVQAQQVQPATHSSLTRAQVQKELADLESVGYNATVDDDHYPRDLQAAEKRLTEKNAKRSPFPSSVADTN